VPILSTPITQSSLLNHHLSSAKSTIITITHCRDHHHYLQNQSNQALVPNSQTSRFQPNRNTNWKPKSVNPCFINYPYQIKPAIYKSTITQSITTVAPHHTQSAKAVHCASSLLPSHREPPVHDRHHLCASSSTVPITPSSGQKQNKKKRNGERKNKMKNGRERPHRDQPRRKEKNPPLPSRYRRRPPVLWPLLSPLHRPDLIKLTASSLSRAQFCPVTSPCSRQYHLTTPRRSSLRLKPLP
jgi:hypothetical protein